MAVQGFKGLGWFLCGVIVAPACYMVNSHGAAERGKLDAMKAAIVQAQKDIRGLETEFDTRANLAQLQRWNGDVLAMAAPAPQQYLASEEALADLDRPAEVQMASLVVPAGTRVEPAPAVVMTAAAEPVHSPGNDKSAAQQDKELRSLMKKADRSAVAMVDRSILSASTMNDLQQLAAREKKSLR
ncbi:MAG: hypothetical protein KF730_06460 [Sphingomonas sp.]|uniref:hypothetical protein n=1 Tax=Sphingomonas sp. TaxID=28214 RepID=UPI0025E65A0D|nr:hypothetical protein [Sphingomonas sp.]MBX3564205.1 hypothetical protein [Sphingomonas sp.]